MALLIALAAIGLFAGGVTAGIVGVVSVAIRREEKNLTMTSEATGPVAQAGRWVNGVYVRVPRRSGVGRPGRRQRHLLQRPLPGTALALQVPSPGRPCTCPAGRDSDAQ
jgi:hypothetical protein